MCMKFKKKGDHEILIYSDVLFDTNQLDKTFKTISLNHGKSFYFIF
jgi:hypothetical protein